MATDNIGLNYKESDTTGDTNRIDIQGLANSTVADSGLRYLLGVHYDRGVPKPSLINVNPNNNNTKVVLFKDLDIDGYNTVKEYVDNSINDKEVGVLGVELDPASTSNLVNFTVSELTKDGKISLKLTDKQTVSESATASTLVKRNSSNEIHAGSFYADSDRNLKQNIKSVSIPDDILKVPIVEFDWIDTKSHSVGVIAQDLEKVAPITVSNSDSGVKSVNYTAFLLLRIAALEKELKEIKSKLK